MLLGNGEYIIEWRLLILTVHTIKIYSYRNKHHRINIAKPFSPLPLDYGIQVNKTQEVASINSW